MSRIRLDYTHVLADSIGPEHGLSEELLDALAGASRNALEAVQSRRGSDLRWLDLPYQGPVLREVQEYAASLRGRFRNVVVLGTGGPALGGLVLHRALNGPFHDLAPPAGYPRLFVLDSVDPDLIGPFLAQCDLRDTLFDVVSRSGSTAETVSQFLIVRDRLVDLLGVRDHREHVVVTTDGERGVLREVARREGYRSFALPGGVGGCFSVLSPAGLLPAALVGIDVEALLAGAAAMDQACRNPDQRRNPALMHAAIQWLLHSEKRKPIAVTLAHGHRLASLADWYAQLLAEALGKREARGARDVFAGPTPVRAVGGSDPHGQARLHVEGRFDRWFTLLAVDEPDRDVPVPPPDADLESVAHLGGRGLKELFHAEREGTRFALTEARRPNATVHLPRVDAHTVGQLIYFLELSVAVMGEHYGLDALDRPGVEAGRAAADALLGRAGSERRRAEIEAAEAGPVRSV